MKKYDSIFEAMMDGYEEPSVLRKLWLETSRRFNDIKFFFRKIGQRFKYGFPAWHAYDFISWHASVVVPRLKLLRSREFGWPGCLENREQWNDILDKMIWSFENINTHVPIETSEDYYVTTEKNETGTVFRSHGSIDTSASDSHHKRVQEGLDLFGEYYLCLWD